MKKIFQKPQNFWSAIPKISSIVFGILVLGCISVSSAVAATTTTTDTNGFGNIGFLESNIWYSKEPFFAGEKVRIYTAIINSTTADLSGTVEFYNDGNLIGRVPFSAASGGGIKEVWMDWVAEEGSHSTTAKIVDAVVSKAGETSADVSLDSSKANARNVFVDRDVNGNNVGDTNPTEKVVPVVTKVADNAATTNTQSDGKGGLTDDTSSVWDSLKNSSPDASGILTSVESGASSALTQSNGWVESAAKALANEKVRVETELAKPADATTEVAAIDVPGVGKRIAVQVENNEQGKQMAPYVRILLQIYLLVLSILTYIFNNKILFYIFLIATLFFTIRFIRDRWFRRDEE